MVMPKLPANLRRDYPVYVRLRRDERLALEAAARDQGKSRGVILREAFTCRYMPTASKRTRTG